MDYLKPLELVTESKDWAGGLEGPSFEADPDTIYPATIAHIRAQLQIEGWAAPEHLRTHFEVAKGIADDVWEMALAAKTDVQPAHHASRAEALEVARRWFTAALHVSIGNAPMNFRITKNEKWRL